MKIHAPRKGSLAYSRRHARKLIPVSSPKQAAVWGTKVGITSVVYQGRVLPVTIIQLAQVEKTRRSDGKNSICKALCKVL